ncbi:MAG: UDP-N-acetylglucosamine 1-carboxyvinyltransferase [Clostridia bacterium]|nr:UDP-N-acetylglucosamine 1-carboxyvinyltransferase [Clostridia bacterium]
MRVSGSKNAALPIIAASILNGGLTELHNVPNISDIKIMLQILEKLGCKIEHDSDKIVINSKDINSFEIPADLMHKMRSSVSIVGALIGRFKNCTFTYPGGCDIGKRPIDLHLKAFEKLGVNVRMKETNIRCIAEEMKPSEIILDFPSVGATENIMLASIFIDGVTIIKNAAKEPEIEDLQNMLNKMGANIKGAGSDMIEIIGVDHLEDVSYRVMPDRIEAGTLLCAVAANNGSIKLINAEPRHMEKTLDKLKECGCNISIEKDQILLKAPEKLSNVDIETEPYPGFPTDMQSIFVATLIQSDGISSMEENIFENRYKYVSELRKMGVNIIQEERKIKITGEKNIKATNLKAMDLRGGAALVIAALQAKGISEISNIEYILRGYDKLDEKLRKLGAKIKVEEGE